MQLTSVLHGDTFTTDDGVEHKITQAVVSITSEDGTEKIIPLYHRFGGWWTVR